MQTQWNKPQAYELNCLHHEIRYFVRFPSINCFVCITKYNQLFVLPVCYLAFHCSCWAVRFLELFFWIILLNSLNSFGIFRVALLFICQSTLLFSFFATAYLDYHKHISLSTAFFIFIVEILDSELPQQSSSFPATKLSIALSPFSVNMYF